VVICLERGADLHIAQLMPLPLTVACFSKIQIGFTFLVPAHPGNPGQTAVKRVCVSQKSDGIFYYIHTLLFKLCYLLILSDCGCINQPLSIESAGFLHLIAEHFSVTKHSRMLCYLRVTYSLAQT